MLYLTEYSLHCVILLARTVEEQVKWRLQGGTSEVAGIAQIAHYYKLYLWVWVCYGPHLQVPSSWHFALREMSYEEKW
jgi:hypothetical protein